MSTDGRYMYHHQPGVGASYDYAPYPPPPPPSSYDNSQISQPPPRQMRPVSTSSQSPTQPYNPPPPPTTSAAYPPPPSYAPNPYMTPTHPTQQQHPPPPTPTQWTSESWAHYNQGYAHQPPSHPPPAHPPPSSTAEPPQYSSAHPHHAHPHTHSHPHSHSHPPPPPHAMHQAPPPPHPSSSLRSTNVSGGSSVAEPQRGYSSGGSSNASTAAPGSGPAPGSSYLEPRRLDERQHPPPLLTQSSSSSAQQHHQHHQQHPHQQHQPPHHPTQAQHHHQVQPPPPPPHSMSSAQYSPSIPPPPAPRRREDESPSTASPGTPTGLDFMKLLEAYRAIIDGSHAVSTTPGRTISADALEHMIQSAAFGAQMLESATMHEKPPSAPVGVTMATTSEVAAMSPEEKEREDVNTNVKSSPNGSTPPSKRQKTDENSGSTEGQTCLGCNATSTPEWRRGPMGPRTLCNACGLVYAKLIKKRVRDRVTGKPKSTHPGNQRTAAADDSGDGESDDEEYGSPGQRSDGGDGHSG